MPGRAGPAADPAPEGLYAAYIARCNEHRFTDLGDFVAPDVNGPDEGLERYAAGLAAIARGFADEHWEPQEVLGDPDRFAVRLTTRGTHRGEFRGVTATGRRVEVEELVIYHVEGGRIVRCWGDLGAPLRDAVVSG